MAVQPPCRELIVENWQLDAVNIVQIYIKQHIEQNRTECLLVWNPYTKDCYQNNTINTKQSKY
jgi:hypothetical protein